MYRELGDAGRVVSEGLGSLSSRSSLAHSPGRDAGVHRRVQEALSFL